MGLKEHFENLQSTPTTKVLPRKKTVLPLHRATHPPHKDVWNTGDAVCRQKIESISTLMWRRKPIGTETESIRVRSAETTPLCPPDDSSGGKDPGKDEVEKTISSPRKKPCLSSRGVQVSSDIEFSDPLVGNLRERKRAASIGGRRMLSARRWAARRLAESSSASESPVGSPRSRSRRKAPSFARVRRLRSFPSPERPQESSDCTTRNGCASGSCRQNECGFSSHLNRRLAPKAAAPLILCEEKSEPISPATSITSDAHPGRAERTGLTEGVDAEKPPCEKSSRNVRDSPHFLQPVVGLLVLSVLAIFGARVGRGMGFLGSTVHAAGDAQLQEAVVDDIFHQADKDHDGVIGGEEIQYLVEGAGGTSLDDASEIVAGVASVIKNVDINADRALSRSDLHTYWQRLGTLLTVDEVAEWVVHAAQLPLDVADIFRKNSVTGYDFPELAAKQGKLLEQDLGIISSSVRKRLVRSMKWKLWGMGEEPAAPEGFRAVNTSCGALSLAWDKDESNLSFPVHKYVLRRTPLGEAGETVGEWVSVMSGQHPAFFDAPLQPGRTYRYSLQAWNALGHSTAVVLDTVLATEGCMHYGSWPLWDVDGKHFVRNLLILLMTLIIGVLGLRFVLRGGLRKEEAPSSPRVQSAYEESDDEQRFSVITGTESTVSRKARKQLSVHSSSSVSSRKGSSSEREQHEAVRGPSSKLLPNPKLSLQMPSRAGLAPKGEPTESSGTVRGTQGGRTDAAHVLESIRREQARRLLPKQSSSQEDKEFCIVCGREWKWYRLGGHTCCNCHELFCDRCGSSTHSFGACPVGGSCMCKTCINDLDACHSSQNRAR